MNDQYKFPDFVETDGDWNQTKARLYQHFTNIFKKKPPMRVLGKPLVFDTRCIDDALEEGFWHVVSRGKPGDRKPDMQRSRRISWIEDILSDVNPHVTRWSYEEGDGTQKIYFWLQDHDFVVILANKPNVVALVTAFYVDNQWADEDLEKRLQKGKVF